MPWAKPFTSTNVRPHVLPGIDPDMAQIIEYELQRFGVRLSVGAKVLALVGGEGNKLTASKRQVDWESSRPIWYCSTQVLHRTWILRMPLEFRLGVTGAISVNAYMETNVPGIFAAGNCAETFCAIRRRPVSNYIGTVAAKQGRVAGENLAARRTKFLGAIGTTVVKVFDLAVARTGIVFGRRVG